MREWKAGALYSVRIEEGFGVAKILVVEGSAIHVRLYREKYDSRPSEVQPNSLTLGKPGDENGCGASHLPLSRREFASWEPEFLRETSVMPEELEGYRKWKKPEGGAGESH